MIKNDTHKPASRPKRSQREKWDRRFGVLAAILILSAWVAGGLVFPSKAPECDLAVLPGATQCRGISDSLFEGTRVEEDGSQTVVGWAQVASSPGYAGDIQVMVGVSPAGELLGVKVLDHVETPSFFGRIQSSTLLQEFSGMDAASPFQLGENVDTVSRATVSANAITVAVQEASYTIAERQLGLTVTREEQPIKFGIPEIVLIALYASGYIGHQRGFKYKKQMRWATMLVGLVALGFIFNAPLTITHFNRLLLGSWPAWRTDLYWFLLVGGILVVVTADNKNPYCSWFCPFGAAQECLGAIGRAKYIQPRRGRDTLKWVQRFLAFSAILIALFLRNPGVSSYEIFGTLFAFNGSSVQWVLLAIILLMSLFVRRPWCHFLCPMDPIIDFINAGRRWIKELWQTKKPPIDDKSSMSSSSFSSDSVPS